MTFGILSSVFLLKRLDSSVGTATSFKLDGRVSIPGRGKIFLFSIASRPALGPTQPPEQWIAAVKRPESEADHSPPSRAEVKNDASHMKPPGIEPQAPL
jgi:hypothetical protein